MASKPRSVVASLLVGCATVAALVGAPTAAAAGADATIADLQAQGYLVNINWINGASEPLAVCTVTRVNNPSSSPPKTGDTVYVDVECPDHNED